MEAAGEAFEEGDFAGAKALLDASAPDDAELSGSLAGAALRRWQHNQLLLDYCCAKQANSGGGGGVAVASRRRPEVLLAQLDELDNDDDDAMCTAVHRAALRYNRAVLCMHLGKYERAEAILQTLMLVREHLEQDYVVNILLLLLDLHLRSGDCSKAEQEVKMLSEMLAAMTSDGEHKNFDSPRRMCSVELSFWIHVYGARLHLCVDDQKLARKEVKSALQILNRDGVAEPGTSPRDAPLNDFHKASALLLKARLECLRENYPKTIKLLNNVKSCRVDDSGLSAVYLNNIACVHYGMKRYDAAGFYFSKAIAASYDSIDSAKCEGGGFSSDSSQTIFYNNGIHMFEKFPKMALKCLESASTRHCRRSLLWIRMAECCISKYLEWDRSERTRLLRSPSARAGLIALATPLRRAGDERRPSAIDSLTRARSLYMNALSLIKDKTSASYANVILGLTYVCLRLGRVHETLRWCSALPNPSSLLATMYKAEALCKCGRVDEAVPLLEAATPETCSREPQSGSFYALVCSAFCLRDEMEKAMMCALRAMMASPTSITALRALVYVLLRMGRTDEAIVVIQRRTPPPHLLEHL